MRLLASGLAAAFLFASGPTFHFHVATSDPGAWPRILSSLGFTPGAGGIHLVRDGGAAETWKQRMAEGAVVIVEGDSPVAAAMGIRPSEEKALQVRSVTDVHNPKLSIVWEQAADIPRFQLPAGSKVFTREKWQGAPLVAGVRHGPGALLWTAVSPGAKGYERFPYLPQALAEMGAAPPLRTRNLWAFFDASYRSRVDLDWFARRWRSSGLAAIHVASWQFHSPDKERDEYLRKLMEACHRNAIQVYAWIELPHVSESFWNQHPEWREKTALGQDAHLDWRRLMNLQNKDCAREAARGLEAMLERFDWDGINLAELYFESLEGAANAARFTPMNADVRREFALEAGFDPKDLFDTASPRHHGRDAGALRRFLDWRAGLARTMQEEWIARMEEIRKRRPHLDLVLTHVDDRYDTRMRDLIGADAGRLLPLLDRHDFTFLIEDPATLWHLGPERYPGIAARYQPLTGRPEKLAIDINIVERYQDVYPTRQQTGAELFQLVHLASRAFRRVALYFEFSILAPDLPWLGAAGAAPDRVERRGARLVVESRRPLGVPWAGPARVNGQAWPFADGRMLWLPEGAHLIEAASANPPVRILDFNGEVKSVAGARRGVEFAYESSGRARAVLEQRPERVEVDGHPAEALVQTGHGFLRPLPRGQHVVQIQAPASTDGS